MSFALDEKKAVLATLFTQGRLTRPAGDRSRRYKLVLGPDDGARVVVRVAPARHRTCERRAVGGQLIGGRYAPCSLEDAAESRARSELERETATGRGRDSQLGPFGSSPHVFMTGKIFDVS